MRLLITIAFICCCANGFAQWNQNSIQNNLVANTSAADELHTTVTDGNGGVIYFYSQNADDIFAQRISRAGILQWAPANDPLNICNAAGYQSQVAAVSDMAGGAFLAWSDQRHGNDAEIYIQHLNANGANTWAANGNRVTNTINTHHYEPALCSDGAGGVIVSWNWNNNSNNIQVSAQRYNSAGVAQWAASGIQLCTAAGFRTGKSIVNDGNNGAIFFFLDTRNDANGTNYSYVSANTLSNTDLYAQRLSNAGALLFTANAVPVCTAAGNQHLNEKAGAVSDLSGGAIVAFDDYRNDIPAGNGMPANVDVYTQRLNNLGQLLWAAAAVPATDNPGNQFLQNIVADGQSGVVVSFKDVDNNQLLLQRINAVGNKTWSSNGVIVSTAGQQPGASAMLQDQVGNFLVAYECTAQQNISAQKISNSGNPLWNAGGIIVSNPPLYQPSNIFMENSGLGNAILSFSDRRNGLEYQKDIFASKLLSAGIISGPVPEYISAANGNWNLASTWQGGVVPPSNAAVTIRHIVTITVNASCYAVAVEMPGGTLTIQPGIQLTLNN